METDPAKGATYQDQAVGSLREAIAHGFSDYARMEFDSDLDPIREHLGFIEILKQGELDRNYAAVWHASAQYCSVESHGLDPVEILASSRQFVAEGYRPLSISVAELQPGRALVGGW